MSNSEKTVEELFSEIEEIILKMQNPEVSLTESMQLYEKGVENLKNCTEQLDLIEKQIQQLTESGETIPLDRQEGR